jgi:hypothetical protein
VSKGNVFHSSRTLAKQLPLAIFPFVAWHADHGTIVKERTNRGYPVDQTLRVTPAMEAGKWTSRLEFGGIDGTIGKEVNRSRRMNGESVFLLWYVQKRDGNGADLLIGVYRSEAEAEAAIDRLKSKAGFVAAPEGFRINRYELNRDHWEDGYVTGEGGEWYSK